MLLRLSELKVREIINIIDGRKLGAATDLEVDMATGKIRALVIPVQGKFLGLFGKGEEIVIPWSQIKKFGEDVVLVEVPEAMLYEDEAGEE